MSRVSCFVSIILIVYKTEKLKYKTVMTFHSCQFHRFQMQDSV